MNDIYKHLYIKYKTKYFNLKNTAKTQYGGSYNFKQLKEKYLKIPDSGFYSKNISEEKFKKFCEFLIEKTKNNPEIKDIKRKMLLEKKRKRNTKEYNEILKRIREKGDEYMKKGEDFEKKVFTNILEQISSIKNIKDQLDIFENASLYFFNKKENKWSLIGEVDAIILHKKEIIAIVEIKKSFDDIPDALFQINRSYQVIKQRNNMKVKIITKDSKDIVIDSSYTISKNLIDISFIFTSPPENIFNIQSKIKFILLNQLHTRKIKYEKLFRKILRKKDSYDKLNNSKTFRYDKDVLETLEFFKNKNDHLIIY